MIVLFTDFGLTGPYVGQMKARICEIASNVPVIDLMHDAPAYDIMASAALIGAFRSEFPPEAKFVCVVDPGVGGQRKAIYVKADQQTFIGPDNGLFSDILTNSKEIEAFEMTWRPDQLSRSFHGRDLFAPVAAMLHERRAFAAKPMAQNQLTVHAPLEKGSVIYIDAYGNCWTNLRQTDLAKEKLLNFPTIKIKYADVFCDTEKGDFFWYVNSSGFVEIARNMGNAAHHLGLNIGDVVPLGL